MTTYYSVLTADGAAALTLAYASGTQVGITDIAVGDGNGLDVTPNENQHALIHEVHRVPVLSLAQDVSNPNWLIIEASIAANVGGFTVREVGLYAGATLLSVGNFPATYKPHIAEGSGADLLIRYIFETSRAAQVTLLVDPGVALATSQSVANAVAAHEIKADPHPVYLTAADLDAAFRDRRARDYFHAQL